MDDEVVEPPESASSRSLADGASTDRYHMQALRILEEGPYAPQCPRGHGRLPTVDNQSGPATTAPCPTCGARPGAKSDDTGRSPRTPQAQRHQLDETPALTEDTPITDTQDDVDDLDEDDILKKSPSKGTRDEVNDTAFTEVPTDGPRGLQPDGTIRTTGWLQIGGWVVSSGIWATLAGLTVGLMLERVHIVFPFLFALTGYVTWKTATRWGWPASLAINRRRVRADELKPGTYVRIHGPVGPVGLVDEVAQVRRDQVRIYFHGGTHQLTHAHTRCYIVELRD